MPVKILLLENIHPCATELLTEHGFSVDVEKAALSEKQLAQLVRLARVARFRNYLDTTRTPQPKRFSKGAIRGRPVASCLICTCPE